MIVIGAGMAGLLAAAVLRGKCQEVWEAQPRLPNNHSAVLRFRSSVVGDALNIPFKKVMLIKTVAAYKNAVADALCYSRKTNGSMVLRSILSADKGPEERYIAPPDFIQQMRQAAAANFFFSKPIHSSYLQLIGKNTAPIISTIPMPVLMKMLNWEHKPEFRSVSGFNVSFNIAGLDAYASIYVPQPELLFSRISITGSEVIAECPLPRVSGELVEEWLLKPGLINRIVVQVCELLGCANEATTVDQPVATIQQYAKILPIDDNVRKRFILWASEKHNIYSFGRFATWRPGLLLDDLINDIRVIQHIVENGPYDHI